MDIYCVQMNPFLGDIEGNKRLILKEIAQAKSQGADLVVFPELALCGYLPGDLLLFDAFIEEMDCALGHIASSVEGIAVILGCVRKNVCLGEKPLLNSAVLIENGKVVGFYDKCLLPNYDVFRERRYFARGRKSVVWEVNNAKIGILICEDMWAQGSENQYSYDPVKELSSSTLDMVINISASPYSYHKADQRIEVCKRAISLLGCPLLYVCQVGGHDELVFDGKSMLLSQKGELIDQMHGFRAEGKIMALKAKPLKKPVYNAMEALKDALVLGLKDYCKKSGFRQVVIGISGGIDSAVVAAIAVEALGANNVLGVALPSAITSQRSGDDAIELASSLGIECIEIKIGSVIDQMTDVLATAFKGMPKDITEENIQARIRGVILMALSNKKGKLLLATGNKSELAVGYCTLYGDMCGGIAPIGDVYKTKVYALAEEINKTSCCIPQSIIDRGPTAELSEGQEDIDCLPSYEILDLVLEQYIEHHASLESMKKMVETFVNTNPQYVWKHFAQDVSHLVEEIVGLVNRNEYKRRQAAHSIRVTEKSFSQGRHFPINKPWPIFHLPQENTSELLKKFPGVEEYLET